MSIYLNRAEALKLINDENLSFPALYYLKSEIIKSRLTRYLSTRNIKALKLSYAISRKNKNYIDYLLKHNRSETYELLKWILLSGKDDDGRDSKYEEILELTGAMLVKYYKDNSVLPVLADMIFERNRKGHLIHNLIWAFFEAHDHESLRYLTKFLLSNDQKDVALAIKLLGFIPDIRNVLKTSAENQYTAVNRWLNENCRYLKYTGECLHLSANPIPFTIDKL